jgi:hypothetical protein
MAEQDVAAGMAPARPSFDERRTVARNLFAAGWNVTGCLARHVLPHMG